MDDNSKNLLLAVILSVIVLTAWQFLYVVPNQEAYEQQLQIIQKSKKEAQNNKKTTAPTKQNINAAPVVEEKKSKIIHIKTNKLEGTIDLKGARLNDLTLLDYKQVNQADSPLVHLLASNDDNYTYFAEFGWLSKQSEITLPNAKTIWHSENSKLTPDSPITLTWNNDQGLTFLMTISVDGNYMFTIHRKVVSDSNSEIALLPYGIINRNWDSDTDSQFILHEGALGVFDGTLQEVTYSDLVDDKQQQFNNVKGWLGLTDKYWLTAIIPDQSNSVNAKMSYEYRDYQNRYQVDYLGLPKILTKDSPVEATDHFFAGAKKVHLLDEYGAQYNLPLFDRAVDFGWLYFITKPIFTALTYFNALLGNFGLAILLLTVCIKALLFPLANKSYVSMHQIKLLQPQIAMLRERHKDNKVALNKDMMGLYKREKVNPASGCLPILLQLPIFFALYKVLFVTIEMRHAPFFGWIDDLSAPDPTSIFNIFGLLPFDAPTFFILGAWPIIMGVTMVLQQALNPKPSDPVQAKVMKMLPYIFIFISASFPAGLVIYWAWNNSLTILQQWFITRRLPAIPSTTT